jgi:hypothetical protein
MSETRHRSFGSADPQRSSIDEARAIGLMMNPQAVAILRAAKSPGVALSVLTSRAGRKSHEGRLLVEQLLDIGALSRDEGRYAIDMQQVVALMPYSRS